MAAGAGLGLLAAAALALPLLFVLLTGVRGFSPEWLALRIAAMLAFTFLFLNIVTGALRPRLGRIYGGKNVQRVHVTCGVTGLVLALTHAGLALAYGIMGYQGLAVAIGLGVLALLAVVVFTALYRKAFGRAWRLIHRLNYLLFLALFVHAVLIGYDLDRYAVIFWLFVLYAAAAAAAQVYRAFIWREQYLKARARRERSATRE